MAIIPQAFGMLYAFVVVICPPKHPGCSDTTKGARVMREDNLGQYTCDNKLAHFEERMTRRLEGRVRARCEHKEANGI